MSTENVQLTNRSYSVPDIQDYLEYISKKHHIVIDNLLM